MSSPTPYIQTSTPHFYRDTWPNIELRIHTSDLSPRQLTQLRYTYTELSVGRLLVAYAQHGFCYVHLCLGSDTEAKQDLQHSFPNTQMSEDTSLANLLPNPYSPSHVEHLDIELYGTPFQKQVWQTLASIPHRHTWSYAQLCQHIGRPSALRAVGTAVGRNPIAIFLPCHRVISSTGGLGGYAYGLDIKLRLLSKELYLLTPILEM